jgi:hypothetical protein
VRFLREISTNSAISGKEPEAFLEQENHDENQNDDGQTGIRGEEILDQPLIRKALALEAVAGFGG